MKTFRIVNFNHGKRYRIDQRHSILFGLVKWWDCGAYDLYPYVNYWSFEDALNVLILKYGDGNFNWIIEHKTE